MFVAVTPQPTTLNKTSMEGSLFAAAAAKRWSTSAMSMKRPKTGLYLAAKSASSMCFDARSS